MCIHNCLESKYSNTGEFGIVYKAQLTHWHGEGLPKAVAVKTLKGKNISNYEHARYMQVSLEHF